MHCLRMEMVCANLLLGGGGVVYVVVMRTHKKRAHHVRGVQTTLKKAAGFRALQGPFREVLLCHAFAGLRVIKP